MLLRFIKNWTLPLAMLAGTAGYFFFARVPLLAPVKPCLNGLIALLTPTVDFCTIITYLLQGGGAWAETEGMAWVVVAVSDSFVPGCCRLVGMLPYGGDVSGSFWGGYGMPYLLRPLPLRLLPVSWVGVHQALLPIHCCLIFWQRWLFRWCFLGLNRMQYNFFCSFPENIE